MNGTIELSEYVIDAIANAVVKKMQEPCEDAISRKAVMDALCDECEIFHKNGEQTCLTKCEEYKFLGTLPSIQPKPKTGHWIRKENEFFVPSRFDPIKEIISTCSLCNARYLGEQKGFKYCPNCGAKMIESEETKTWNGIHAQITAPRGTFERIFNDADDDNDI